MLLLEQIFQILQVVLMVQLLQLLEKQMEHKLEKKLDEAVKFTGPVLVEVNVQSVGEMPRYFAPPPYACLLYTSDAADE